MKTLPSCCHDSVTNHFRVTGGTQLLLISSCNANWVANPWQHVLCLVEPMYQKVAVNTFLSSPAWSKAHRFCVMHIYEAFIANCNSFLWWKCCSAPRTQGLRLASRWLLTLLCGLKLHGIALSSSPALCGSDTLLTMLSAICIRTVNTSSLALAVQHNETPAQAPPHLLPCYSTMTFAPCLQSYFTGFYLFFYWRMHHKLAVTRKPIYGMFTVSLTSHERRLLSSRKMYIFAEGTNWLFFFFNLPPSCTSVSSEFMWGGILLPSFFLLLHWCCSPFLFPVELLHLDGEAKRPRAARGTNKSAPGKELHF